MFIYRISKSFTYSLFIGFIALLISKIYTLNYLIIFSSVFILTFLICYFFTKEIKNTSLNENLKHNLNSDNFETILNELNTISKDTTLNRKEFLKQQQGNANANW